MIKKTSTSPKNIRREVKVCIRYKRWYFSNVYLKMVETVMTFPDSVRVENPPNTVYEELTEDSGKITERQNGVKVEKRCFVVSIGQVI